MVAVGKWTVDMATPKAESTTDEETFPRIDLARHRVTSMHVSMLLSRHEDSTALLDDLLSEYPFLSVTKYQRSKKPHVLTEQVHRLPNDEGALLIEVIYSADEDIPEAPVPKVLRREGELLSHLAKVPLPASVSCRIDFRVDAVEPSESGTSFLLPMRLEWPSTSTGSPIDEIRGIRGIKWKFEGDDAELEYDFILDRPTNGPIFLSVDFGLNEPLTARTPDHALKCGTTVAAGLALPSYVPRSL